MEEYEHFEVRSEGLEGEGGMGKSEGGGGMGKSEGGEGGEGKE